MKASPKFWKIGFSALSAMIIGFSAWSQVCALTLSGKVTNAETGEPMPYSNIFIKDTGTGTVSDENGNYLLRGLCPGDHLFVCTRVDCADFEHVIHLSKDTVFHFTLHEEVVRLNAVEVTAGAIPQMSSQSEDRIGQKDLAATKGLNLGESLRKLPGVNTLNTGASISKPVIQGMHSNRLLILNNGVKLEGQQWGLEHAPEIDPFLAQEVQVIKGAAGVRYGSGAIGGVIEVLPPPLRDEKGLSGELDLAMYSQGQTGVASFRIDGALGGKLPLSGRFQGTLKKGGNVRSPDYYLENTGLEEANYSWTMGLNKGGWKTELFYANFYSHLGIFKGAHIGNLTDLNNAIQRGRPLTDGSFTYEIARPFQRIQHETLKARTVVPTGNLGKISMQWSRQFNRRQEFDAHRPFGNLPEDSDQPDIELEVTTHIGEINWSHLPIKNLKGSVGIQGEWQQNTTDRGALIPNFTRTQTGVYWVERWRVDQNPLELEGGIRYDWQWLSVEFDKDTLTAPFRFANFGGSLGAIYHGDRWNLRLNAGHAWRAPHVSELFSNGVHHGSASYEEGNPNLSNESALHTGLTFEWTEEDKLEAGLNLYANFIRDFIFLEPRENPELTIRGAFPAFRYQQADARLVGLDGRADLTLLKRLHWLSGFSILRARNLIRKEPLVFMPADRVQSGFEYRLGEKQTASASYLRVNLARVFRQNQVPDHGDYSPPPDGYFRVDLEGAFSFSLLKQPVELGVAVFNLTDTRYRDYLNRFRYFTDEPGRNLLLRLKFLFH